MRNHGLVVGSNLVWDASFATPYLIVNTVITVKTRLKSTQGFNSMVERGAGREVKGVW